MKLPGFTYIEVILSVALLMYIGMVASPFYGNFLFGQESENVTRELRGSLAKARLYSMTGRGDDSWGVTIDGNRIVLFKGSTYGARDGAFDEVYMMHDRVTVTGLNEIVFARQSGIPSAEALLVITYFTNVATPESHRHTLSINALGVIDEDL